MTTTLHNGQPTLGTRAKICERCGAATSNGNCVHCDAARLLRKFQVLPERFAGHELVVHFGIDFISRAASDACRALDLPLGDTAYFRALVHASHHTPHAQTDFYFGFHAVGTVADQLLDLPSGTIISARAQTQFALSPDDTDGEKQIPYSGLRVLAILETRTPTSAKSR